MIESFKNRNIVVIGDLILDKYIYGDVSRINPEAPVPILDMQKVEYRLGGAANTAANISSLGGKCTLIGQVGNDSAKEILVDLLRKQGINFRLIETGGFHTIEKTRIIAKNQQVIRVDLERFMELSKERVNEITELIQKDKSFDLILISDYAKGMVTKELIDGLKRLNKKIVAGPKPKNIDFYRDVFLVSLNLKEAREIANGAEIDGMGKKIVNQLNCNVVITRGEEGCSLFTSDKLNYYVPPKKPREICDVVGAGDTFIAALSLALASQVNLPEACLIANHAAGISVGKLGTSTVSVRELSGSFDVKNKKIVFTNGCFDILHVGHIKLLRTAKSFGDVLILGLNTDSSIKKIKGPSRPINNQEERAEVLSALDCVDYIAFFDENDPCKIISELKPDVHVKGGDYNPHDYKQMPEAKIVHDYGGEVKIIELVEGKSTTSLIETIKK